MLDVEQVERRNPPLRLEPSKLAQDVEEPQRSILLAREHEQLDVLVRAVEHTLQLRAGALPDHRLDVTVRELRPIPGCADDGNDVGAGRQEHLLWNPRADGSDDHRATLAPYQVPCNSHDRRRMAGGLSSTSHLPLSVVVRTPAHRRCAREPAPRWCAASRVPRSRDSGSGSTHD